MASWCSAKATATPTGTIGRGMWFLSHQVTIAQDSGLEDCGVGQGDRHGLRHNTTSLHTPLSCMGSMPLMSLVPDAAMRISA